MEKNEKRKLQELGGSLYVSLPSAWISQFKLKKASTLNLSINNLGELKLYPEQIKEEEKTVTIKYNQYIFRNLIRAYLFGNNIIIISKQTPFTKTERSEIFAIVNNLLNLEIIEEQRETIIIQNLKADIPIRKMVSRMFHLTKSMMEDLLTANDIINNNKELLQSIIDRDTLVGKFYLAIIMQIRASLTTEWSKELSFVELLDLRLLIERIEKIGDEVKALAKSSLEKKKFLKADLEQLLQLYNEAYGAYWKNDLTIAEQFWDKDKEYKQKFSTQQQITQIYEYIKDITDLII